MSADSPIRVRVLVNALHARSGGGVTYLRNMLPHLAADARLEIHLLLHRAQRGLATADSRIAVHEVDFPDGFLRVLVWEQLRLPGLARRIGADVTFSPANFGPLCTPRSVIVLRNALAVGELDRRPGKRIYWAALSLMTVLSLLACRRAIAVSAYARDALTRRLPARVRRKVAVVHHGVGPRFAPAAAPRAEEKPPFLLAVGDIYLQKNLHGLVAALPAVLRAHPGIVLKIAGAPIDAAYLHRVKAEAAALGVGGQIAFLGRRSEDELIALYRGCTVFVFPSSVETFGNPLLEAMACGAPIASAGAAAMPEVVGDAALLFDPARPEEIAQAIVRLLGDAALRRTLAGRGLQRARTFTWERTAATTADLLVVAARDDRLARRSPVREALLWGFVIIAAGLYVLQFRSILPAVSALFGFA